MVGGSEGLYMGELGGGGGGEREEVRRRGRRMWGVDASGDGHVSGRCVCGVRGVFGGCDARDEDDWTTRTFSR